MKKILTFAAAILALFSCGLKEEFQPVFTGQNQSPEGYKYYTDADFGQIMTIRELVSKYETGKPVKLTSGVIKGVVTTTDRPGNFYKSLYIQDATGGIELKLGKNGLYNDYLVGQTIYVDCADLTLGMYGYKSGNYGGMGMAQLGFADPSGQYETSYLEIPLLIDSHILRGNPAELHPVEPKVITSESELPDGKSATQATDDIVGSLVTLKGLTYGKEVFCLLYLDSNKDKKSYQNRVFLSPSNNEADPTCGITTWAMSKEKMTSYVTSGIWDVCKVGSGNTFDNNPDGTVKTLGSPTVKRLYYVAKEDYDQDAYETLVRTLKEKSLNFKNVKSGFATEGLEMDDELGLFYDESYPGIEKAANSISQYFKLGSKEIQIRTSGYCRFCDVEIDPDVLAGKATIDVTGILTLYQGSIQFVVNNISDIKVNK